MYLCTSQESDQSEVRLSPKSGCEQRCSAANPFSNFSHNLRRRELRYCERNGIGCQRTFYTLRKNVINPSILHESNPYHLNHQRQASFRATSISPSLFFGIRRQTVLVMAAGQATQIFRQDAKARHVLLTKEEREDLLKPYLPPAPKSTSQKALRSRQPVRDFVRTQVYILFYNLLHAFFSVYIRLRQTYHVVLDRSFAILYYHHRAPELIRQDVRGLKRFPEHLSVILELTGDERGAAGFEKLMDDVAEISTWCTCVGIPMLSIYEKTGRRSFLRILKRF